MIAARENQFSLSLLKLDLRVGINQKNKTMKKLSLFILVVISSISVHSKSSLAVLNFDVVGKALTKDQFISITRSEIAKLDSFQVVDKYTIQESLESNQVDLVKCLGTNCLVSAGRDLKVDFVVAGGIEVIADKAILILRLIDVQKGVAQKTSYTEYVWDETNAQRIIQMAVFKLFDRKIEKKFLSIYDYETAKRAELEGPKIEQYNLSGPRFGVSYQTGSMGNILSGKKSEGGFNKLPFMTVIGYQAEKQYLYTGSMQAVFQFNFSLAGLDQQMAIPSVSFLNGFRSTIGGWEFGFGPSIRIKKEAEGFYRDGEWKLMDEKLEGEVVEVEKRLDSRGVYFVNTSWIWAVGKSFKAGNMNIPINFYTIPDKDGWLFGLSMGYALHK